MSKIIRDSIFKDVSEIFLPREIDKLEQLLESENEHTTMKQGVLDMIKKYQMKNVNNLTFSLTNVVIDFQSLLDV